MVFFTAAAMLTGTTGSAGGGGADEQAATSITPQKRITDAVRRIEQCRVRTNMVSLAET
jgi:hypothetical protein